MCVRGWSSQVAAAGGLFAASPTSKANALGSTFTDINVPGLAGVFAFGLNDRRRVAGSCVNGERQDRCLL